MQIVVSKISDDPRCLYKHPQDSKTLTAQIKEAVNLMSPTFYVVYDSDVLTQHYNYAEAWGRYYFITDIQVDIGGAMRISCKEDVLHTYADQIVQCPIVAERSANAFNAFISDPERHFYQYTNHQYIELEDIGKPDIICILTVG